MNAPAGNEGRVEPLEDFIERQADQNAVAIVLRTKDLRGGLAQFAERDFNRAPGKLSEDFLQRNHDSAIPDVGLANPRLEFEGQSGQDFLEGQFDAFAILLGHIAADMGRGETVVLGAGWLLMGVGLRHGCLSGGWLLWIRAIL